MHVLLLLFSISRVSVFAQNYQGPVSLAVNVFFDNQKKAGAVQQVPGTEPDLIPLPAYPTGLGEMDEPPFPNLTHHERMKLACEAISKSPPQLLPYLQHQIYVCQHMFRDETMEGIAFRRISDDDSESRGFFNITVEFCINGVCEKFNSLEGPDVQSLNPKSSESVTHINITAGIVPALFAGAVAQMPNLEHLKMDSLGIEIVEAKAFENLPNIKYISLQSNYILMVDAEVFSSLNTLEELHLEHNSIIAISPNAFANMVSLRVLGLSYNALDTYDEKWFQNNLHLNELHLEHNELIKIPSNAFRTLNLKNNISIYLDKNRIESAGPDLFDVKAHNNIGTISLKFNKLTCIEGDLKNFFVSSNVHLVGNPLTCECLTKIVTFTYYNTHPGISLSPVANCHVNFEGRH